MRNINYTSKYDLVEAFVEQTLKDESFHVMLGPVVWQPTENGGRYWYFAVCSGKTFTIDQINTGDDKGRAHMLREALHFRLIQRRPIVVHDFDDELDMAEWCARIWPCEQTRRHAENIRREREER